ncbi:MAG: 4Fe-4S binding protein [Desulfosalsimonadaceae bacterium]
MKHFRRTAQVICLFLFLLLLASGDALRGTDLFARMDPVLTGIAAISGRVITWAFLPALLVLVSAPLFGRLFCGYICPMGTTIDMTDSAIAPKKNRKKMPGVFSPGLKTVILFFLIGAAVLGVSFVFWGAPLSLITRFYGMVIYPVAWLAAETGLTLLYPVFDWLDLRSLMFLEIEPRRYAANFFVLLLFAAVFAAASVSPRFWCRYLCPTGALLALLSKKPLIRRQVDDACDQCGKCARHCPMEAIASNDGTVSRHEECIACRTCETICPREAIRFSTERRPAEIPVSHERRRLLISGLFGAGTAAVGLSGLMAIPSEDAEGGVLSPRLIRPPGALPEPDFLRLCVRCGQCMTGCPTNTLQPVWFSAGLMGMFSPAVVPTRKYCDPQCRLCGNVCPTGAILKMTQAQRVWAKTGTAIIYRRKCLAWEYKKSCMVCDEVCPYKAVEFEERDDLPYPVPHVIEDKCSGCGYCEHYCPVENDAAIVVTPMNALRLKRPLYREEGRIRGYALKLRADAGRFDPDALSYPDGGTEGYPPSGGTTAPGFDEGIDQQ